MIRENYKIFVDWQTDLVNKLDLCNRVAVISMILNLSMVYQKNSRALLLILSLLFLSKVSLQLKALGGVFSVPAWPGACPCSPCPSWGWGQGAALPSPGRPGKRTRRSPGSQSSAGSPTAS